MSEQGLLRQSAAARRITREADSIARKNEQLEAMLNTYKQPGKPKPWSYDDSFDVFNVGSEDVKIIRNFADPIVIKPSETHIFAVKSIREK